MIFFGEGAGGAMQCLACGTEMELREVVLADIPTMPGFEPTPSGAPLVHR